MPDSNAQDTGPDPFRSQLIESIRSEAGPAHWDIPGGTIILPRVFGFCQGVRRAVMTASGAASEDREGRLILLGPIIHNPWVNDYFMQKGVEIISRDMQELAAGELGPGDRVIVPAFGSPPKMIEIFRDAGCEIIDCSCGDVIRVWKWSEKAVSEGYGVIVFGRALHDETIVTKARIEQAGGSYLVLENLGHVDLFGEMIRKGGDLRGAFDSDHTNADSLEPFQKMAQVSQTTMLYDETMRVSDLLRGIYIERFGEKQALGRVRFQATVCRATQERQDAAKEVCSSGCDAVIVIGGFNSSNTRHLYELAGRHGPAYLVEGADSVISADGLVSRDRESGEGKINEGWLGSDRPVRIGVLAGASTPDIVTGQVLERLKEVV